MMVTIKIFELKLIFDLVYQSSKNFLRKHSMPNDILLKKLCIEEEDLKLINEEEKRNTSILKDQDSEVIHSRLKSQILSPYIIIEEDESIKEKDKNALANKPKPLHLGFFEKLSNFFSDLNSEKGRKESTVLIISIKILIIFYEGFIVL